jgi:hypothetical protein
MKVHWSVKWLNIPYGPGSVLLQGIMSKVSQGTIVQLCQLSEEDLNLVSNEDSSISLVVSPKVQLLLDSYAKLFATKVIYPPSKEYCHTIPLVQGARPVNNRQYRYALS